MSSWSKRLAFDATCFLVLCSGKWSQPADIFQLPRDSCVFGVRVLGSRVVAALVVLAILYAISSVRHSVAHCFNSFGCL